MPLIRILFVTLLLGLLARAFRTLFLPGAGRRDRVARERERPGPPRPDGPVRGEDVIDVKYEEVP